jgi:hypothetical protein
MVETFGRWAADRYRKLAEEFRTIADTMMDAHTRAIYTGLAADYDRMAERADKATPASEI